MTSPSVDLDGILPYGLNVSANTSTTYITPDGDSSRADGSFVLLPVGPCQVQFTWPGKQDAYVRWVDSANNEKGVPIEISGGGVFPKDRYHRCSLRRQTTGAHPLQRRAGNYRNGHNLPDSALTRVVVKHDRPYQVCESVAVGHAYGGHNGFQLRFRFEDERHRNGTKHSAAVTRGCEYSDRGLGREIASTSQRRNRWFISEDRNSRRGIGHTPAGHAPRAGKHLGCLRARHNLGECYGGDWEGGRRYRRLPIRPNHHLTTVGVV